MKKVEFEPRVLAFCCHYCAYAAADLAGTMWIQYPPNVRIIRTPCTGRLETEYLIKAFENGADGVLVAGCLEGGCHFTSGNLYARRRVEYMRGMLEEMGLEKERLRMVNISAAMARPLADAITDMVETVRKLGPSPVTHNGHKRKPVELRIDDFGLQIESPSANPQSEIRNRRRWRRLHDRCGKKEDPGAAGYCPGA
jgi:coenzyme F420-reducing hydrogenase delta subunit